MLTLAAVVSPEGVPLQVRVEKVAPEGYEFEKAAAKALWSLRMDPATLNGRPVHGFWRKIVRIYHRPPDQVFGPE